MRRSAIAIAAALLLDGCSSWSYSAELLQLDENTCMALPRHLPACVIGVSVKAKTPF